MHGRRLSETKRKSSKIQLNKDNAQAVRAFLQGKRVKVLKYAGSPGGRGPERVPLQQCEALGKKSYLAA